MARGTVGRLTLSPDSRNVMLGRVWVPAELRAGDAPALERMEAALRAEAGALAQRRAVGPVFHVPVTPFATVLVERLRAAVMSQFCSFCFYEDGQSI